MIPVLSKPPYALHYMQEQLHLYHEDVYTQTHKSLKHRAPRLPLPLHIDIPPEQHTPQRKGHEKHAGEQHTPLHEPVCSDNRVPRRTTHGEPQLDLQRTINLAPVGPLLDGEILAQLTGQEVGPDSAGDGLADGAADAGEEALEGEDDGDFVVRDGRHGGQLLGHDESAAGDGVEDLSQDDEADGGAWVAEVDEEDGGESGHGDGG